VGLGDGIDTTSRHRQSAAAILIHVDVVEATDLGADLHCATDSHQTSVSSCAEGHHRWSIRQRNRSACDDERGKRTATSGGRCVTISKTLDVVTLVHRVGLTDNGRQSSHIGGQDLQVSWVKGHNQLGIGSLAHNPVDRDLRLTDRRRPVVGLRHHEAGYRKTEHIQNRLDGDPPIGTTSFGDLARAENGVVNPALRHTHAELLAGPQSPCAPVKDCLVALQAVGIGLHITLRQSQSEFDGRRTGVRGCAAVDRSGRLPRRKVLDAGRAIRLLGDRINPFYHALVDHILLGCRLRVLKGNETSLVCEERDCINPAAYATAVQISSMTGATLTAPALGALGDGYLAGGLISFPNVHGATERRAIESHAGNTIAMLGTTDGIEVNDWIVVYPGCDRTTATCQGKFNNLSNYGGFPHLPTKSPFDGDPVF